MEQESQLVVKDLSAYPVLISKAWAGSKSVVKVYGHWTGFAQLAHEMVFSAGSWRLSQDRAHPLVKVSMAS